MATIQFDLVSPERKLASLDASEFKYQDQMVILLQWLTCAIYTLRPGVSVKWYDVMEYM